MDDPMHDISPTYALFCRGVAYFSTVTIMHHADLLHSTRNPRCSTTLELSPYTYIPPDPDVDRLHIYRIALQYSRDTEPVATMRGRRQGPEVE